MTVVEKGMLDDYSLLGEKDPRGRQIRHCVVEAEGCCRVRIARRTMIWTFFLLVESEELQDGSVGEK
jgi:hypothetical protein